MGRCPATTKPIIDRNEMRVPPISIDARERNYHPALIPTGEIRSLEGPPFALDPLRLQCRRKILQAGPISVTGLGTGGIGRVLIDRSPDGAVLLGAVAVLVLAQGRLLVTVAPEEAFQRFSTGAARCARSH